MIDRMFEEFSKKLIEIELIILKQFSKHAKSICVIGFDCSSLGTKQKRSL
jgi:hypothetical protein